MKNINKIGSFLIIGFAITVISGCQQKDSSGSISGSGTIEVEEVQISPLVAGRITRIYKKEGETFEKDEILVTLSGNEIQADVDASRAAIDAAVNNVRIVQSNLANAQKDYNRARELFDAGSLTRQELDQAENRFTVTRSQLSASQAQLRQIQASSARANTRLKETVIQAPISGTVLTQNFYEGEVVMPGSYILSVANMNNVYLKIYVGERDIPRIKLGQKAWILADGVDKKIEANVVYISGKSEFTPKNIQTKDARARLVFAVKLVAANANGILKPGLPADGEVVLDGKH